MAKVERPLSPHLQIYRPQITSVLSILHRLTGCAMALGGILLCWWLVALGMGPEAFARAKGFIGSPLGILILFGMTFSLWYHLCNGLRHLAWDTGWGFELDKMEKTGWAVVAASTGLTVLSWIIGLAM